jgi:nicotinate phosphoribosyltransferase
MGVSRDAPGLDIAYKLVEYKGRGRTKLSTGKRLLPGRKQVFRVERDEFVEHDVLGRRTEEAHGRPLLRPVMAGGRRLPAGCVPLAEARNHAARERDRLPARVRGLAPADPPFAVDVSPALAAALDEVEREHSSEGVRR